MDHDVATRAELAVVLGGKPDLTKLSEIDLEVLGRKFRMQRIVFEAAHDVFDQMKPGWNGNRDALLSQLIHLVERMLTSNRITIRRRSSSALNKSGVIVMRSDVSIRSTR